MICVFNWCIFNCMCCKKYLDLYNSPPQVTKPWAKSMSASSRWIPLNDGSPPEPDEASLSSATPSYLTSWTKSWFAWRTSWKVRRKAALASVGVGQHPGSGASSFGWEDGWRRQWACCQNPRRERVCQLCLSCGRVWPSCTDSTWLSFTSVVPSITCPGGWQGSAM